MKPEILSKTEIEQTLRNHEDTLRGYSVKWLGLFGSYVKGAARDDSDIDLVVEFEKLSFDNYMGLRIFLEDLFDKKIDLVISNSVKPRLKPRIEKEVEYVARL
ncbi:MAG: nucleotidyltransferase family protein [Candidatus Poribacteria bacterium]|nr:nucleotidyltransferase family protein [Candidatus Poribacteria bacterium]